MKSTATLFLCCVVVFFLLLTGIQSAALEGELETGEEELPIASEEEAVSRDEDDDSMLPVGSDLPGVDQGIASEPWEEEVGETQGGNSPWGGLLFMIAAVVTGVGLAIARNQKK